MSRENRTPYAHSALHQLHSQPDHAHQFGSLAIKSVLLDRRNVGQRLLGGVRGGERNALAGHLRRHPTQAERALWVLLCRRRFGVKFKRKAVVHGWIVDFYAPDLMLVIKLDHTRRRLRDAHVSAQHARVPFLRRRGCLIVRFTSATVLHERSEVERELQTIIARRRVELGR